MFKLHRFASGPKTDLKDNGEPRHVPDWLPITQSGKRTENTYSTGDKARGKRNRGSRSLKSKYARRSCHSFTSALLIIPLGVSNSAADTALYKGVLRGPRRDSSYDRQSRSGDDRQNG